MSRYLGYLKLESGQQFLLDLQAKVHGVPVEMTMPVAIAMLSAMLDPRQESQQDMSEASVGRYAEVAVFHVSAMTVVTLDNLRAELKRHDAELEAQQAEAREQKRPPLPDGFAWCEFEDDIHRGWYLWVCSDSVMRGGRESAKFCQGPECHRWPVKPVSVQARYAVEPAPAKEAIELEPVAKDEAEPSSQSRLADEEN